MRRAILLANLGLFLFPILVAAQDAVDYVKQIKPLLKEHCFSCHGALRQKANLRLDTVKLMRDGQAIVPGKDADSPLIERVTSKEEKLRMPPPSESDPLSAKQIELLRQWIREGAKGITDEKPEPDPREHWAFRKPVRPRPPTVKNPAWVRNPIDAFVAMEHERHGLTPRPEAPRGLLLRRLYLDLIGLPPTREELTEFLEESAKPNGANQAYEKVVDKLLASPHYGERWGRHWMDVWRYSDWYGRRHVPDVWNSAPQIWRWREWIVKSLNSDKGYDRMVQEMLAADEIAPEDDDALVATGYIVRNWYALNPHQWKRDMVEHTGKAFLGLTFNCAHCHDHKYDPISQEEYFRFRAFFEPLELRQDRVRGEEDPGLFQKYDYSSLRKIVKLGAVRVYDDKLEAKTLMYAGGDERNILKDRPPVKPGAPAFLGGDRLKVEPVMLPAQAYYPGLKPFSQQEEIAKRQQDLKAAEEVLNKAPSDVAKLRMEAVRAELTAFQARAAAANASVLMRANADELARTAAKAERQAAFLVARERVVLADHEISKARKQGADLQGKEKDVALATLKKLETQLAALKKSVEQAEKNLALTDGKYSPLGPIYPKVSSGRRKALAEWLTSADNPLTARVAVNHIWLRHFNQPLVETVFDFGRNGKKPSHPELLDWLATEFMAASPQGKPAGDGWRMKQLHRLIVTSATYRMHSTVDEANLARDADNRWLWRANAKRMEAEVVRDSILASAGELDRTVGGMVLENKEETTSKRRGLYFSIFPEDGGSLKFFAIFDAPDPSDCYRRSSSVMPQQALALTNNVLAIQQSRILARKLSAALPKSAKEQEFVNAAFEHLLSRSPTRLELEASQAFLQTQTELFRRTDPKELKGASAGVGPSPEPVQRARESLIRVMYNHNDFVSIR